MIAGKTIAMASAALFSLILLSLLSPPAFADGAPGVDNDQGEVSYHTYTVSFEFRGTDAQWILWDFGFEDEDGPVTSEEWNPSDIVFPGKGSYTVTQTVGNTVGAYVSQMVVNILGTPEVTFDTHGGSPIPMQTVRSGHLADLGSVPVKDGFAFGGWYTDENLEHEFPYLSPITRHITLHAKWIPASGTVTPGDETPGGDAPGQDVPGVPPGGSDNVPDDNGKASSGSDETFFGYIGGLFGGFDMEESGTSIVYVSVCGIGALLAFLGYRRYDDTMMYLGFVLIAVSVFLMAFGFDILGAFDGSDSNGGGLDG